MDKILMLCSQHPSQWFIKSCFVFVFIKILNCPARWNTFHHSKTPIGDYYLIWSCLTVTLMEDVIYDTVMAAEQMPIPIGSIENIQYSKLILEDIASFLYFRKVHLWNLSLKVKPMPRPQQFSTLIGRPSLLPPVGVSFNWCKAVQLYWSWGPCNPTHDFLHSCSWREISFFKAMIACLFVGDFWPLLLWGTSLCYGFMELSHCLGSILKPQT